MPFQAGEIVQARDSNFYLYKLLEPVGGNTFYVGTTSNPVSRLSGHISDGKFAQRHPEWKHNEKSAFIAKLLTSGAEPVMKIAGVFKCRGECLKAELALYASLDGLLNSRSPKGGAKTSTPQTTDANPGDGSPLLEVVV